MGSTGRRNSVTPGSAEVSDKLAKVSIPRTLPTVISAAQVTRLLAAAANAKYKAVLSAA